MNLTPRQLRILVSLAGTLSFSRTAEAFHLTQPALSRIVRAIEEEAGMALFARTTRQVRLTQEGRALSRMAARLVEDYDSGLAEMRGVARRRAERISIAALPSLAAMVVPDVAKALRSRSPNAEIVVRDVLSDQTLDLLHAGEVDFALTSADPRRAEIAYEEVMRDRYVLLARSDDERTRGGRTIGLMECLSFDLISMPVGTAARLYTDAAFLGHDVQFRPSMTFEHLATIGKFVSAGFGIALLPCLAAMMIREEKLTIVDIADAPVRSLGIVRRQGEARAPLVERAEMAVRARAEVLRAAEPKRLLPVADGRH